MDAYNSVFWQALAEKAYEKFLGSHQFISGVSWIDTYVDLCGGVVENYSLFQEADLFQIMTQSLERSSTITTSVCNVLTPTNTHCMALIDHAYVVTTVKTIQMDVHVKPLRIVVISNLFTDQLSTSIPNIENSYIWKLISEEVQDEIRRKNVDNGEVTMRYQTFLKYFDHIKFHHVPGEFATGNEKWQVTSYKGLANRPTIINLEHSDDHDQVTAVVSVMQANRSNSKNSYPRIKFEIYSLNKLELEFSHRVNYKRKTPVGTNLNMIERFVNVSRLNLDITQLSHEATLLSPIF